MFGPIPTLWVNTLGALLCVAVTTRAAAQPVVTLRAGTRIGLRVEGMQADRHIAGTLQDDVGRGLGDREVMVTIGRGRATGIRTTEDGSFVLRAGVVTPGTEVRARFWGDRYHEGTAAARRTDAGREPVWLRIEVPPGGSLALTETHHIAVFATTRDGPAALTVALEDERGVTLGQGYTGTSGIARWRLRGAALGPPGAGRLRVRSLPDAKHQEALSEVAIVRWMPTALSLAQERTAPEAAPGVVRVSGKLSLEHDRRFPLQGQPIGLSTEAGHVITVITDAKGVFRASLQIHGAQSLRAHFESSTLGLGASRSELVPLSSPSTKDRALWPWSLAVLTLCGLLAWRAERRKRPLRARTSEGPRRGAPGFALSRQLHGKNQTRIAGQLIDAHRTTRSSPAPALRGVVRLRALRAPDRREVATDVMGHFAFETVAPGDYELTGSVPGYRGPAVPCRVPHSGEHLAMMLRFQSVRRWAEQTYRDIVVPRLPQLVHWPSLTNREAVDAIMPDAPCDPRLRRLARVVDSTMYGPGPIPLEDLKAVESLADDLRQTEHETPAASTPQ